MRTSRKGPSGWMRHYGLIMGAFVAGNLLLAMLNIAGEMRPDLCVRTDATGHSDLVVIGADERGEREIETFVEEVCLRLFEGASETADADEAYLRSRVGRGVIREVARQVRRFDEAGEERKSVSVESLKVLTEEPPWRVEARMRLYGVGQIVLPATASEEKKQGVPVGVVATVEAARRTEENPAGLVLSGLTPVML